MEYKIYVTGLRESSPLNIFDNRWNATAPSGYNRNVHIFTLPINSMGQVYSDLLNHLKTTTTEDFLTNGYQYTITDGSTTERVDTLSNKYHTIYDSALGGFVANAKDLCGCSQIVYNAWYNGNLDTSATWSICVLMVYEDLPTSMGDYSQPRKFAVEYYGTSPALGINRLFDVEENKISNFPETSLGFYRSITHRWNVVQTDCNIYTVGIRNPIGGQKYYVIADLTSGTTCQVGQSISVHNFNVDEEKDTFLDYSFTDVINLYNITSQNDYIDSNNHRWRLLAFNEPSGKQNTERDVYFDTVGGVYMLPNTYTTQREITADFVQHYLHDVEIRTSVNSVSYGDICCYNISDIPEFNGNLNGVGDTITVYKEWKGERPSVSTDEYFTNPQPSDSTSEVTEVATTTNLLTSNYNVSSATLKSFATYIWSATFLDNLKLLNNDPIENIIGCRFLPFNVQGGESTTIVCGNVDTSVSATKLDENLIQLDGGSISIEPYFDNFLDYEPYTSIDIYIPFIGRKTLIPSQVVGKTIRLKYAVDVTTGFVRAKVLNSDNYIIDEFEGNCGIEIPLTGSNRSQYVSNLMSGLVAGGMFIASGNAVGGVTMFANTFMNSKFHSERTGHTSPNTELFSEMTAYLVIERPEYMLPSDYGKQRGFVCNKTCFLSDLKGFTVLENADFSGIPCTEEEGNELIQILESGFYL